jgi:lambda family phage minor tail protein L
MAEGINQKVASEAMSLEPSQILEFYLIYYAWPDDQNSVLALTPISPGESRNGVSVDRVVWQGQEYIAYPMEVSGFEVKGDNSLPRPRLKLSNIEFTISKYLKLHNNLIGAKLIRKRTFARFLDDLNFPGGKNPYFDIVTQSSEADGNAYLPDETYYINRRTTETKELVELELSTVFELDNTFLPNRNVYSKYCTWVYRGHGCLYSKEPKKAANDEDFKNSAGSIVTTSQSDLKGRWDKTQVYDEGDHVFIEIPNHDISDDDSESSINNASISPLRTFYVCVENNTVGNENFPPISANWQRDECSKKISACKLRFGKNGLRFGGFPGTHAYPPKG